MKLSIILRTSDFRGDHEADVAIAYEVLLGETIEALAQRLFTDKAPKWEDVIEIRLVKEPTADDA